MDSSNNSCKYNIGVEIGGTNIKIAVVKDNLKIIELLEMFQNDKIVIKELKTNENPEQTVNEICKLILDDISSQSINKVCISNFGPLNLHKYSDNYGKILNTPKPGWKDFNVIETFSKFLKINNYQIVIELDVNCAAYLEHKLGNHNVNSLAYITIGTGVGVGVVINGGLVHGLQHPEGGHINVKLHNEDEFLGVCPIHGNCLEGLISNNAIKERKKLNSVDECPQISDEDNVWDYISFYIAQLCLSLLYLSSIEKIIIGGGVINREILLERIRKNFISLNNNYIDNPKLKEEMIHQYIDRTSFKNLSGILSAFSLIMD